MEEQTTQLQQKESIKLKKNAKGDMEWEIKLHINEDDTNTIKRLKQLNEDLQKEYGKNN